MRTFIFQLINMKNIFVLIITAFATAFLLSYTFRKPDLKTLTPECYISCFNIETREMIQLDATKPGFAMLHANPNYFKLETPQGENVEFPAADGLNAKGYFLKSNKKSNKWLFVIQEWWGLNDYIKLEAEKYYGDLKNVNVLAIDMYDGKVATTRDSATVYMSNAKKERLETIVNAALSFAGKKAEIFTVGWCFGGGWSLQASLLAANQAKGCVMFYGRPEKEVEKLKPLKCDVIGFFGNYDKGINIETVNTFESNMMAIEKNLTLYRYDAGHGFANPSNPSYNKEFTADAYQKAIAFIKKRM